MVHKLSKTQRPFCNTRTLVGAQFNFCALESVYKLHLTLVTFGTWSLMISCTGMFPNQLKVVDSKL